MAPFVIEYIDCPLYPSSPATLATLIITPFSCLSVYSSLNTFYLDIYLATYFEQLKVPTTLIYNAFYRDLESATDLEVMIGYDTMIPAQLISTLIV